MKTYQEMLQEIRDFKPWREPAGGVLQGFVHAPQRCIHISYTNRVMCRVETLDCICGAKLDRNAFTASPYQPAPLLWEGLQAFYKHLGQKQEEAKLK